MLSSVTARRLSLWFGIAMNRLLLNSLHAALWSDLSEDDEYYRRQPKLAHYTSVENLEKIMASKTIWFSKPLLMNDFEELKFGILEGAAAFRNHELLQQACGTDSRYALLQHRFEVHLQDLDSVQAFDIYVFSL